MEQLQVASVTVVPVSSSEDLVTETYVEQLIPRMEETAFKETLAYIVMSCPVLKKFLKLKKPNDGTLVPQLRTLPGYKFRCQRKNARHKAVSRTAS